MLKNYFKIAFRNLIRNKVISFINIAGLALGMAGAILLILNVNHELSIDQFHKNKATIYKAFNKGIFNGVLQCWDITPAPLGPALKKDYPEVTDLARVTETSKLLSYGSNKIELHGDIVDPSFLKMFSFPLREGNTQTSLEGAYSIVITEQLAKDLFGNEDPINKNIVVDNTDNFTVKGVLKDLPDNTQFKFDYLLSWDYLKAKNSENPVWSNSYVSTYLQLRSSVNIDAFNDKIADIEKRYSNNQQDVDIFLYPLTKLYLYNHFRNGKADGGRIENVHMLRILAGIMLLIACINFMNLSTARSERRAKEVGVRKAIGAGKSSLIFQFIGESILLSLIAGIISLGLIQLALPVFSTIAQAHLTLSYQSPLFWLTGLAFVIFTGILAGSYPAFYLSSFKPVLVLKGVSKNKNSLIAPRKILVITQFVFSIFLINFSIVFQKQLKHGQDRELGFIKENLIYHPLTADLRKNYKLVKEELISSGTAVEVSTSTKPITHGEGTAIGGLEWDGMDPKANVNFQLIDSRGGFVKTNGLQLLQGRDIDVSQFPTDTASVIINEAALKVLGFKDPIGKLIRDDSSNWKIVGVVKDFLVGSPNLAVKPMLIMATADADFINIRLNGDRPAVQNAKNAEAILKKYNPNFITAYQFADEDYAAKFRQAKITAALIDKLVFVAIFISCMGLFGLATYMAESRVREIGIRKVLGASATSISALLVRYFVTLVMIAIVIASPLAWLFMNFFLQQFDYRTDLSLWILLLSGSLALLIALFTVSYQSIKAALANPTRSLRSE